MEQHSGDYALKSFQKLSAQYESGQAEIRQLAVSLEREIESGAGQKHVTIEVYFTYAGKIYIPPYELPPKARLLFCVKNAVKHALNRMKKVGSTKCDSVFFKYKNNLLIKKQCILKIF